MILSINSDKCKGCRICEVFCSLHHENRVDPELSRIHVRKLEKPGHFVPVACILCDQKACLTACREPGAISIDAHGAVVINEQLCTGCSRCARACPQHAVTVHRLPGRGKNGKAVAIKCDLCGGDPVCAKTCPSGALSLVGSDNGQILPDGQLISLDSIQEDILIGEPSRARSNV